jgi:hypothetical protein
MYRGEFEFQCPHGDRPVHRFAFLKNIETGAARRIRRIAGEFFALPIVRRESQFPRFEGRR